MDYERKVKFKSYLCEYWRTHNIDWQVDSEGRLTPEVVPRGQGHKKPVITWDYEEITEEQRERNKRRIKKLVDRVKNIGMVNYDHKEVMESARRLGRMGRVRLEEEYLEKREKLEKAKEELGV